MTEKTNYSDLAAPIVTVPKLDGTVCIVVITTTLRILMRSIMLTKNTELSLN